MAQDRIRFYLDENLSPDIATQLTIHGLDIIRGPLGDDDSEHLKRSGGMGRTLCTEDDDFLRLLKSGVQHSGIVKGENTKHSIGTWVEFLKFVHATCTADEMRNRVEYVFRVK